MAEGGSYQVGKFPVTKGEAGVNLDVCFAVWTAIFFNRTSPTLSAGASHAALGGGATKDENYSPPAEGCRGGLRRT
ncbi:MAG: hypothetical protein DMG06_26985 [Acidobacteria bacterium]|nr:MAG: hypothetical protein DMG06_26985 [Acidobacteriota bacterium]